MPDYPVAQHVMEIREADVRQPRPSQRVAPWMGRHGDPFEATFVSSEREKKPFLGGWGLYLEGIWDVLDLLNGLHSPPPNSADSVPGDHSQAKPASTGAHHQGLWEVCVRYGLTVTWVWVKTKPPGDRRFWSMFPVTGFHFG